MSTRNEINAVNALNRYVYDLLFINGVIPGRGDYGGRTPVIPSQQLPELTQYNHPFLVYAFSEGPTREPECITGGTVTYAIYSVDDRDIISIINIMREAFKNFDDTASDVNVYKRPNIIFREILFTSIHVGMVEGPSPAQSEGGRSSGFITLRYSYSANYVVTPPTNMT